MKQKWQLLAGRIDAMLSARDVAARFTAEMDKTGICQAVVPVAGLLALTARTLRQVTPRDLHGQLGYYSFDGGAPITAGTWQAAYSAAQVALSAQAEIAKGAHSAFALCRPPGHHAAGELMGGYCYLNNAAIAAQHLTGRFARVAVNRRRQPSGRLPAAGVPDRAHTRWRRFRHHLPGA